MKYGHLKYDGKWKLLRPSIFYLDRRFIWMNGIHSHFATWGHYSLEKVGSNRWLGYDISKRKNTSDNKLASQIIAAAIRDGVVSVDVIPS